MDAELLERLKGLRQRDIATRDKLLAEGRLYGTYEEELQRVHRENAEELDEIISLHGWPGVSKVGIEGSWLAWMVANHAVCMPDLQRKFLKYLSMAAGDGDVPYKQVALLTDRVRFNEGRPQVYGTVFDWNESGKLSCELESPEYVDEFREDVGLPPFAKSFQEHRRWAEEQGEKPPEDYAAYKLAAEAWARRIGWR